MFPLIFDGCIKYLNSNPASKISIQEYQSIKLWKMKYGNNPRLTTSDKEGKKVEATTRKSY